MSSNSVDTLVGTSSNASLSSSFTFDDGMVVNSSESLVLLIARDGMGICRFNGGKTVGARSALKFHAEVVDALRRPTKVGRFSSAWPRIFL